MRTNIFSSVSQKPIDIFDEGCSPKNGAIALSSSITGTTGERLDAHFWLPMAAKSLDISPDIKDYIVSPVIAFWSDIPNTNGDSISKEELFKWNSEHGRPAYKTFKGKPTYVEHQNRVISDAKGIILDVYISPLKGYHGNHAKIVMLAAFDKQKDRKLADAIKNRKINTYSIGAYYDEYICSTSNIKYAQGQVSGKFTRPGMPTYVNDNGQIVYRKLLNIRGFELSSVATPAYCSAVSDDLFDMGY